MENIIPKIFILLIPLIDYGQCAHQLNMYDSWGDGWNGNAVDVSVNGSVVSGATISTGFANFASFNANSGDTIELTNWITGSGLVKFYDITDGDG